MGWQRRCAVRMIAVAACCRTTAKVAITGGDGRLATRTIAADGSAPRTALVSIAVQPRCMMNSEGEWRAKGHRNEREVGTARRYRRRFRTELE